MKNVRVEVCRGTSCHLLGSQELLEALESLPDELRERIDLCTVDCLKNCRQGPNVRIDQEVCSGLTPEQLKGKLEDRLNGLKR